MKMFFKLLSIIYLIGCLIIAVMIATNRLKLINNKTQKEVEMSLFIELIFILNWPLVVWLIIRDYRKDN